MLGQTTDGDHWDRFCERSNRVKHIVTENHVAIDFILPVHSKAISQKLQDHVGKRITYRDDRDLVVLRDRQNLFKMGLINPVFQLVSLNVVLHRHKTYLGKDAAARVGRVVDQNSLGVFIHK